MRKQVQYIPQKGMNKDLSISKFSPEFTYDNYNMRLNANEENTLFTITNAKGNVQTVILDEDTSEESRIEGNTIGYCILNEYLVLFTTTRDKAVELIGNQKPTEGIDRIYRLRKDSTYNNSTIFNVRSKLLFEGTDTNSLNFAKDSLIETLPIFESNEIQKVYWVDKNNQPRFINITSDKIGSFTSNSFEFCPELKLQENYEIKKSFSGGSFHSGVVQYAFSYWNRNGVESNIFLTTDVYSLSEKNRAGSAEEIVNCSFKITISNLDTSFDYVRMYAIQRTSLDGTSIARIVKDVELNKVEYNQYSFTDDGVIGSSFPAESLFFIGGEELIIGSITTKDNTLFGSNLKLKRPYIGNIEIKDKSKYPEDYNIEFAWKNNYTEIQHYDPPTSGGYTGNNNGIYTYKPYTLLENHLGQYGSGSSNTNIRHWKKGETYRLGIQAQYKTGIWSEVIYIGDYIVDKGYKTHILGNIGNGGEYFYSYTALTYITGELKLEQTLIEELTSKGFKKIRPVYVPLTYKDRHIIGQGILTNTISNVLNRGKNNPFSYADYYTRGQHELVPVTKSETIANIYSDTNYNGLLSYPIWQHFSLLRKPKSYITNSNYGSDFEYSEIKGIQLLDNTDLDVDSVTRKLIKGDKSNNNKYWEKQTQGWFIDSNLVNLWSPDVEYGDVRNHLDNITKLKFRGSANISSTNINYNFISSVGANDGNNLSMYNFMYTASRVLSRFGVNANTKDGWNDSDRILEEGHLWDSKKINDSIEYRKKSISRFVYCGFNDMFLDNNSEYPISFNINTPKFIDKTDVAVSYNSNGVDGASGNISYLTSVDEVIGIYSNDKTKLAATSLNYKVNSHLLLSFKSNYTLPIYSAYINSENNKVRTSYSTPWYRKEGAGGFSTPTINNTTYLGIDNSKMVDRTAVSYNLASGYFNSGWPYLWIVDLFREISDEVQYGGKDINAINQNTWIPCGNSVSLSSYYTNILYSRGDTYIQRYDCLKTTKGTSDFQDYTEVVSVLLESFVNIDGRWDSKRGNLVIKDYTNDNYTLINPVYTQKNNFFTGTTLDSNLLAADSLPTSFLWSEAKVYNESIDKWTGLWLNNSYTVDGSLGAINYVDTFNNELYGFQDKGIFQILFNSRVQVPTSDNTPIELVQSWKTQGVRYITNNMGVTNKWTIKQSSRALYFIDSFNRDICLLNTPPSILSDSLGFKTWSQNHITKLSEYNVLDRKDSFITNIDEISDNVYFNNTHNSLMYSETLNQFESFFSHEDIPFMFNIWGDFLSIKNIEGNTSLWVNHRGDYNSFYGELKKSHIEFYINPEMPLDKVFDNFQYRADMFDGDTYMPRETFNSVYVENEYQKGSRNIMNTMPTYNSKKFRIWNFPFPRQENSLNRIRNPWVKLKLELTNNNYRKLLFHDLIITYTS